MDAVLPLTWRDLPRARILLRSLEKKFEKLGEIWVVCPDHERSVIERGLASHPLALTVLEESALVPEFRLTPWLGGWYRQQLVKLAIYEKVKSELYLTLDADVVCAKAVSPELIAPRGLGPCHTVFRDLHPDWYRHSAAVLDMRAKRRGISHNVTPAVLHRVAVGALARYLEERARLRQFARGFRGFKQRLGFAAGGSSSIYEPWRLFLALGAPWTEYALYYTFLEATGAFERFHEHVDTCLYDVEGSIWRADRRDFAGWRLGANMQHAGAPWFIVVQSNTGISPAAIEAKLFGELSNA
ncbi:MAG TPA: DUF6492 family protein [Polyangiaceae bacterium]|nr:DUF6492 family protein [Polyangiaceae bacterium]